MKKWVLLIIIALIAIVLRFYKLGVIPYGYTWDEAAITYNSWGISLWYRDEYATKLPLVFKSFGDYKAPLLFYALATWFKLFGLSEVLIRIYSAIAGVITTIASYFLVKEIFPKKVLLPPLVGLLVAISPWAIQVSRFGLEANIALMFTTIGFLFLFKGEQNSRFWYASALSFALSLYSYQNTKIFIPAIAIAFFITKRKLIISKIKEIVFPSLFFIILILPMFYATLFSGAAERGKQTLIFFESGNIRPPIEIIDKLASNYKNQLSPAFFINGFDSVSLRHMVPGFGALYKVEFLFLLLGIFLILNVKKSNYTFLFAWFLIGFLPATLANKTPHGIRSLLVIPAIQIIIALGFLESISFLKKKSINLTKGLVLITSLALIVNVTLYLKEYYGHYAINSAKEFQYGYKQAFEVARVEGKDKKQIIVTDKYGQPYIYALLYNRITPEQFLAGGLANYLFVPIHWPEYRPKSLYLASPEEIPLQVSSGIIDIITIPKTDIPVFVIAKTPEQE